MSVNGLDAIIDEAIKAANKNHDILIDIKTKSKALSVEDIFEIGKIFFIKEFPNSANITVKDFIKDKPQDFFPKVLKGFCVALITIGEEDITEEDKKQINYILRNTVPKPEN